MYVPSDTMLLDNDLMAFCVPIRVLFLSVWATCIFLDSSQRGDLSQRERIERTRENGCLRQDPQVHLLVPRVHRPLDHRSRVRWLRQPRPRSHLRSHQSLCLLHAPLARPLTQMYRRNFAAINPLAKQTDLVLNPSISGMNKRRWVLDRLILPGLPPPTSRANPLLSG
jgi:hypothetical protein